MAKYRFGVIFNIDRHIRRFDTTGMFEDVNRRDLLEELVKFLTEGMENAKEARQQINEIEYLIGKLYDKGIIQEYVFSQDEPYVKICGILYAICESIVEMFEDIHLFDYIRERGTRPVRVIPVSRSNFAIVVKHPLRNGTSHFCYKAQTLLRRVRE
ncbi:hypothetical protein [Burkholderia phage FLC6]|nr:hypothetical protein [Burkholderia phage FLC6]